MIKKFICIYIMLICVTFCYAASYDKSFFVKNQQICSFEKKVYSDDLVCSHAEKFDYKIAAILGITQGITEFLPISSTGHMIIVEHVLNKKSTTLSNASKDCAMKSYFAIIQCGSILAIFVLYWRQMLDMLSALLGKNKKGAILIKNLLLSFLPAGVLGVLLDGIIQNVLYHELNIAYALIFGAILILYAEFYYTKKGYKKSSIDILSSTDCIKIGLWQCLALIPGMSRSMSTIVGGYFCGLSRKTSAEYSFLLGFVTLSAATVFKFLKNHEIIFQYFDTFTFLEGILVAFLFSILSIKLFISYLSTHGLRLFVWYRVLLGILIIFLFK